MMHYVAMRDWKKWLRTIEASQVLINTQTFNNGHRKLQKIPLDSEYGCFKSVCNLLGTQSLIVVGL